MPPLRINQLTCEIWYASDISSGIYYVCIVDYNKHVFASSIWWNKENGKRCLFCAPDEPNDVSANYDT